jgi:hypothetical protein
MVRPTDGFGKLPCLIDVHEGCVSMTEPESHTLAYLRRLDEKLDRFHSEAGERFDRIEGRLDQIADELLVLNGIALRLEGREMETTGLKAILGRHER